MYHRLHRSLGIASVLFLLIFVMTGLALQHSPWLGLDQDYIPAWLAERFYNTRISATTDYPIDGRWVSHAGTFLYIDGYPIPYIELNNLQGVVQSENYIWVVGDNKLWLLSKDGEVLDELSLLNGLPAMLSRIGRAPDSSIVVGGLYNNWLVDESLQNWEVYGKDEMVWATPDARLTLPAQTQAAILNHANDHLIKWERLLLDFHSGRLFGTLGLVVADIAAILLLFLAATGVFLWLKGASMR